MPLWVIPIGYQYLNCPTCADQSEVRIFTFNFYSKAVYFGYDSMFLGDLKTPITLKLLQNILQDVSLERPWDFFAGLIDGSYCAMWHLGNK